MEKLALELISDGIMFLHLDDDLKCIYCNKSAINILGYSITTQNWLDAFTTPKNLVETAQFCMNQKEQQSQTLFAKKEPNLPIQITISPFNDDTVIVTFPSPHLKYNNLQEFLQYIDGITCSIVEYHPEFKISDCVH